MAKGYKHFTKKYDHRSRDLMSKVSVGIAFNPDHTSPPERSEFDAIWDTGATGSVISKKVVKKCGLLPIGMTKVLTANGECDCRVYLVSIGLPNKLGIAQVSVTESEIGGADMLIGMDIIGIGDFAVSNFEGKTVFTFRYPSIERIDFGDEIKRQQHPTTGRNSPCPCGSGKKYKKCHGVEK